MKKISIVLAVLIFIVPSVSIAAALTAQQASSLIAVVQSSPGTPASAFTSLITAFSNISVTQADSLITVVQAAPSVPANAFVNLLTSFTVDTSVAPTNQQTPQSSSVNSCNGLQYPVCSSDYSFVCPSNGGGYCAQNTTTVPQTTQPTQTETPPATTTQTPTVPATQTQTNGPWVDIEADGSSGPISEPLNGPAVTISWSSGNVLACGITGVQGWSGNFGTSGSKLASFTASTNTVTIQCSALVNNVVTQEAVSDSVEVDVAGANQAATTVPVMTAAINRSYANQTIAAGTQNVELGSFLLNSIPAEGEGLNVNAIEIGLTGSQYSGSQAVYVKNLLLRDHSTGEQLGQTISVPATSAVNDFSLGANLYIPESGRSAAQSSQGDPGVRTVDIYGDIAPNATGTISAMVTSGTSATGATDGTAVELGTNIGLQTITVQ